ncbi:hypothetical protein NDR87_14145 [Nocardia sp. CDC159]|uniref:Uncharacterized protein n=1 Tax=Nocardia pulmonis TaxID=2951408 RepID=A0A9X2E7T0_9NOCA|nr:MULTISPECIES: hypothetical protein [Nocardia]MCM6774435.1 hypothetical protein [Nocardia pulmonis]MCM6787499.1 hypothetical protein [Nocardia sp. CDC159]
MSDKANSTNPPQPPPDLGPHSASGPGAAGIETDGPPWTQARADLLREVQDKAWIHHEMTAEAGRSRSGPVMSQHWAKVVADCDAAVQRAVRAAEEAGVAAADITRARELGGEGVRSSGEAATRSSGLRELINEESAPSNSEVNSPPDRADQPREPPPDPTESSHGIDEAISTVLDYQPERGWRGGVSTPPPSDPAPGTDVEATP